MRSRTLKSQSGASSAVDPSFMSNSAVNIIVLSLSGTMSTRDELLRGSRRNSSPSIGVHGETSRHADSDREGKTSQEYLELRSPGAQRRATNLVQVQQDRTTSLSVGREEESCPRFGCGHSTCGV